MKVTGNKRPPQQAGEIPVRIPLQFKDQRSANNLWEQLSNLSRKINTEVHPVFTSHKIKDEFIAEEHIPPIVTSKTMHISLNVICVMQIMSALHATPYINV